MSGNILDTDALSAQYSAQDADYAKQAAAAAQQRRTQEEQAKQPPTLTSVGMQDHGHVTSSTIDSLLSWVEGGLHNSELDPTRGIRDIGAGLATGAANIADAVNPANVLNESEEQVAGKGNAPISFELPVWDHAKAAILDFRDALAVKDPHAADNVLQAGAQLVPAFMAYSKALSNVHGFANTALAGAATDMTALQPHDMRTADLIALGRQTDTKLGAALRAFGPHGLNAYVNFLADRSNETEAEGRFKNALDGLGANLILTPLLHAAGIVVKVGRESAMHLAENGVGSFSDLLGPPMGSRAAQSGQIVFHGTGSDFHAFDDAKIGTGEGNQTFGYGHYFAENPDTAGYYQQALVRRNGLTGAAMSDAGKAVDKYGGRAQAYSELNQQMHASTDPAERASLAKQMSLIRSGNYERGQGNLMHVEIPDEHIGDMFHWDEPINEQPNVQKVISNLDVRVVSEGRNFRVTVNGKPGPMYMDRAAALSDTDILRGEGTTGQVNAGMFYDQLSNALGSPKAASEFLSRRGITGIRYLDQGSRDAGEGTHNIVLFNAKHARIVAKNGEGVRPPLKQGGADPMEAEAERQARIDADAAERNPDGKRPPLKQGGRDLMEALAEEQARADAARHVVVGK